MIVYIVHSNKMFIDSIRDGKVGIFFLWNSYGWLIETAAGVNAVHFTIIFTINVT